MTESILDSIKGVCGIEPDDDSFDNDVIMAINSELGVLNQVGIGPAEGFMITGPLETWTQLLAGEVRLNMVKTYLQIKTRLLFDPPTTSYQIAAWERQADMFLWRIKEHREGVAWTPPVAASSTTLLD